MIGGDSLEGIRTVAEAGGNDLGTGRPDNGRSQTCFLSEGLAGLKLGLCIPDLFGFCNGGGQAGQHLIQQAADFFVVIPCLLYHSQGIILIDSDIFSAYLRSYRVVDCARNGSQTEADGRQGGNNGDGRT
ncbi:hypothetical protein D3C80_1655280 [compost metagenome]